MDTGTALLKAVLAAPDDDLPRLVYADWLEENGNEWRANYIRVVIHDKIGRIEYGGWESGNPFGYDFGWHEDPDRRLVLVAHRGFVVEVRGPLEAVLESLPHMVRRELVARVVVTDREPQDLTGFLPDVERGRWFWFGPFRGDWSHPQNTTNPARLPACLREPIPDSEFPSREAAVDALSAIIIAWAKAQPAPEIPAG
jgi:uncharacterized protein (TIGR02996 family)